MIFSFKITHTTLEVVSDDTNMWLEADAHGAQPLIGFQENEDEHRSRAFAI
jgi:hypothetical protein